MATARLQEFVGELRFLGESIAFHDTGRKKLGMAFMLNQFGMNDELATVRRHYPEDEAELCTWLAELAEHVTAGRLQDGPGILAWTLPGTTSAHWTVPPGDRPIPGPSLWRDARWL